MENEIKWEVVEELSDENGTPNCWAYKIGKANLVLCQEKGLLK